MNAEETLVQMNETLTNHCLPEYLGRIRWVLSKHHVWHFGLELDGEVVEPDTHVGSIYSRPMREYRDIAASYTHVTVLKVVETPYEKLPDLLVDENTRVLAKLLLLKGWAVS